MVGLRREVNGWGNGLFHHLKWTHIVDNTIERTRIGFRHQRDEIEINLDPPEIQALCVFFFIGTKSRKTRKSINDVNETQPPIWSIEWLQSVQSEWQNQLGST